MRKCLVTGGRGFIGQQLVKALRYNSRFDTIVSIGRFGGDKIEKINSVSKGDYLELNLDICDALETAYLINTYRPDTIFHLAGCATVKPDPINPDYIIKLNVNGTYNLLEACPIGTDFVLASSAAVYGDAGVVNPCNEYVLPEPTSVYGATKLSAESLLRAYSNQGKIRGLSLRLIANVGPNPTHGLLKDVVRKLKSNNPFLELLGDSPGSTKPYIHIFDAANAILYLEDRMFLKYECFNIGPNDSLSVLSLARAAMSSIGIVKEIKWLGESSLWAGDNYKVIIDNSKLNAMNFKFKYKNSLDAVYTAAKEIK